MRKRAPKPAGHEDLGHQIALDPTCKQGRFLARAAGCSRFAYNWGLREWRRWRATGKKPTADKLKKSFNAIRGSELPWTYESPRDATAQPFNDLGKAYSAFFASRKGTRKGSKVGPPKFRKKGLDDCFYLANDQFKVDGKRIRVPLLGWVKMHEELRFDGKLLGARIFRRAARWYVSIQVQGEFRRPTAHERVIVGVDLGIKTAMMLSNGEQLQSPKPLGKSLRALRRANRRLHRRQKGSRNRYKARMRVAQLHARIGNIRRDWVHKTTTRLTRENQAVVIEDLNVKGMLRNERLARRISDVGFGMIRSCLTYKGRLYGCEVKIADRYFPSSKRCSSCGNVKGELSLSQRVYSCDRCGLTKDRDKNAALNLEKYPGLLGNWGRKAPTPVEIEPLPGQRKRARQARSLKRELTRAHL